MGEQLRRRGIQRLLMVVAVLIGAFGAGEVDSFAAAQTTSTRVSDSPPNVVVFLVDDMGLMDTSVPFLTGPDGSPARHPLNDLYRTPAMERLAARGTRFEQFCAMSVCSPTRLSLMTGHNAARHRTTNWIRPDGNNRGPFGPPDWNWLGATSDTITLPRLLASRGYRTIHIGKGHFGPNDSPGSDPRTLGFDVAIAGSAAGQPGNYYGNDGYGVPGLDRYRGTGTFLTEALTREALREIDRSLETEQPFFLYLAHYAVHAPFHSDPRFADHYRDRGLSPQAQAYATLIEGMDRSLGDLLDHLEARGIADDTLVLFLGDNGSDAPLGGPHDVASSAPLRGKKGSHYEGGMRAPLIIAWADADADRVATRHPELPIRRGVIETQLTSVLDLMPTILAATGTSAPNAYRLDGADLSSLLAGTVEESRPERFLMHYPHAPHRSDYFTVLRDGEWKVIYHYRPTDSSGGSHYQLFRLSDDPFEANDLAASEPEVLRRMMQRLVEELEACDALFPIDEAGKELRPIVP